MICGCRLRGSAELLIGHSSFDRPADSLMHMLMHCHLLSAYDSLSRFSVGILFHSCFIVSEHDNAPKIFFTWFSQIMRELTLHVMQWN